MHIYGAYNLDNSIREQSSSGGMFTLLAKYILNKDGVVFAVRFDDNCNIIHDCFDNIDDIDKFRGSKYVRSKMGDTLIKVKKLLDMDRYVLFVGTPCQVQAVKNFLGKDYEKLLTCDLICHGAPEHRVWEAYVKYMENKYNSKIKNMNFREKENGWRKPNFMLEFENGVIYKKGHMEDEFTFLFNRDYILNASCYKCRYTNTNRVGDFTIGDFWGVHERRPSLFDNKGTSLIFVNTKKAEFVFDTFKDDLKYEEITVEESMQKMLREPASKPEKYELFWEEYNKSGLISALDKIGFYNN